MEETIQFRLGDKRLYGIFHLPEENANPDYILIMITGGPQTRVGSHRSYVKIARKLCRQNVPILRFDYAGIGDSEGEFVGYEYAMDSIRAAVDAAFKRLPSVKHLLLWSLCDGSSATAFYAPSDKDRISGLILCNPFVVSEQGKAQTYLKHYYLKRIFQMDFLRKVLQLKFNIPQATQSLFSLIRSSRRGKPAGQVPEACRVLRESHVADSVVWGISSFGKPIRFLLSTDDYTAMEFKSLLQNRKELSGLLKDGSVSMEYVKGADHTFTETRFKDQVVELTLSAKDEFLQTLRMGGRTK